MGPLAAVAGLLVNPLGGWNPNGAEAMALYEDNRAKQRNLRVNELTALGELADLAKKLKATPARHKPTKP